MYAFCIMEWVHARPDWATPVGLCFGSANKVRVLCLEKSKVSVSRQPISAEKEESNLWVPEVLHLELLLFVFGHVLLAPFP